MLTQQDIAILLVRLAQRAAREADDAMSCDMDALLTTAMSCYREASEALGREKPREEEEEEDDGEAEAEAEAADSEQPEKEAGE